MSKFNLSLVASIVVASAFFVSDAKAQSLEQAVASALHTHPEIRQAFSRFKSREEDVNAASSGYLPSVDVTAGYGYEFVDSPAQRRSALGRGDGQTELMRGEFGITIRQLLFDGMFTSSEVDRNLYEAGADKWTLLSTAEDLALAVSRAYLLAIKAEQFVVLSQKNVASHEEILVQIKERTESGVGSIADLSQATGRLARAQSNLIAAQNNLLDAQTQYDRLTNTRAKNLVMPVPDADMLPANEKEGLQLAIAKHPVIKSASQDIKAATAFKDSVKASYYPTFTLELEANSDNDINGESGENLFGATVGGHRNDFRAMVRMRYNLYEGGRNVAQEKKCGIQSIRSAGN